MSKVFIPKIKEIEKVVYSPIVVHCTEKQLIIHRIITDDNLTRIDFIHYVPAMYENGGWVQMHRECFIRSCGSAEKLTLVQAVNIPYAPTKHYYRSNKDFLCYTLYFPALPKCTTAIDIIESEAPGTDWFNFYGVSIQQALSKRLVVNN
ncbi:MAG: hypothetical protein RIQ33_89 [Bacteroidota bacterium]|jgi:hypothetical protein